MGRFAGAQSVEPPADRVDLVHLPRDLGDSGGHHRGRKPCGGRQEQVVCVEEDDHVAAAGLKPRVECRRLPFVGLEDGLEGLLHISELSDDKVENAEELFQVGDPIDVKILRVDIEERKIGLSKKQVSDSETSAPAETAPAETSSDS